MFDLASLARGGFVSIFSVILTFHTSGLTRGRRTVGGGRRRSINSDPKTDTDSVSWLVAD